MPHKNIKNQLRFANAGLNKEIALQEETLLEKESAAEALLDSERRYRRLFESAKDGILILDGHTGKVVDVNPFLLNLLGYSHDALCGKHIWEIGLLKDIAASKEAFRTLQENEFIRYDDLPLETSEGKAISVEFVSNVYFVDHAKVIQCNIRDITARKRNEDSAETEHKRLMSAIEQVAESVVITDANGNIQFVNPAFEEVTGYSRVEAIGQNPRILKSGEQDKLFYRNLWETISGGRTWSGRIVNRRKDGTIYTEEATISPVRDSSGRIVNYVAVKREITDELRMSAQIQQSQKMEAVGILAGGVAHDYNNMLGVILGYTERALKKVDATHPLHDDLEAIYKAAKHSADITRQLLTFARKQTIVPIVLDLNQNVENMLVMIQRLIGEDIQLSWLPEDGLWPIKMDPIQFDQILANLCVNARDAISGVGKVTLEARNLIFDEDYCAHHAGITAGEYVLLAVSDNGSGMDKHTLDQIFEPFFTSKDVGQGTGLGLSIVYGIVKQNNGFISVRSEPGEGTTFSVYLPRYPGQLLDDRREMTEEIPFGRGETVMIVEDEPSLLTMARIILEDLGYRVLAASTPGEAIKLAEENADKIQLAITDVIMPDMNGRELAEKLQSLYPSLRILFMSGYTSDAIARRDVLDEGVNFIQKPFSTKDLAFRVREALREN
ncbi:MAG: PAS domain S-box protein [Candidatus Kryptoniota bacterium]